MRIGADKDGREIVYGESAGWLKIGGIPTTIDRIIAYDSKSQIDWDSEEAKAWAYEFYRGSQGGEMGTLLSLAGDMLTAIQWRWAHDEGPGGADVLTVLRSPRDTSSLWHFIWVEETARRLTFSSQDRREVGGNLYWESMEYTNCANFLTTLAKVFVYSTPDGSGSLRMSHVMEFVPEGATMRDLARVHRAYMIECVAVSIEFAGVLSDGMAGAEAAAAIPARIGEIGRG